MEIVEIKGETITVKWKAIDGKLFDTEKECVKYEKSPVTMLKAKLNIAHTNEWDLCFGNEDDVVYIVNGDKSNIAKYISVLPAFDNDYKLEAINNALNEKYTEDFLIFTNYDGDLFKGMWKQQLINRINNTIKEAKEEKENK